MRTSEVADSDSALYSGTKLEDYRDFDQYFELRKRKPSNRERTRQRLV